MFIQSEGTLCITIVDDKNQTVHHKFSYKYSYLINNKYLIHRVDKVNRLNAQNEVMYKTKFDTIAKTMIIL